MDPQDFDELFNALLIGAIALLIVVLIVSLGMYVVLTLTSSPTTMSLSLEPIHVPDGFEFLGASCYGKVPWAETLYIQSANGDVFRMDENGVLTPISVPEGFTFLDGSADGRHFDKPTYYLRNIATGQVYKTTP